MINAHAPNAPRQPNPVAVAPISSSGPNNPPAVPKRTPRARYAVTSAPARSTSANSEPLISAVAQKPIANDAHASTAKLRPTPNANSPAAYPNAPPAAIARRL
jgi:hypothetical protein